MDRAARIPPWLYIMLLKPGMTVAVTGFIPHNLFALPRI